MHPASDHVSTACTTVEKVQSQEPVGLGEEVGVGTGVSRNSDKSGVGGGGDTGGSCWWEFGERLGQWDGLFLPADSPFLIFSFLLLPASRPEMGD